MTAKRSSRCWLVMIEWEDSVQPSSEWQFLAQIGEQEAVICRSVGWLIKDTARVKVLAPNFGGLQDAGNLQVSGRIVIPTSAVRRTVRLKEPA